MRCCFLSRISAAACRACSCCRRRYVLLLTLKALNTQDHPPACSKRQPARCHCRCAVTLGAPVVEFDSSALVVPAAQQVGCDNAACPACFGLLWHAFACASNQVRHLNAPKPTERLHPSSSTAADCRCSSQQLCSCRQPQYQQQQQQQQLPAPRLLTWCCSASFMLRTSCHVLQTDS